MFLGEVSLSERFERIRRAFKNEMKIFSTIFMPRYVYAKSVDWTSDIKRQVLFGLWSKALVSHLSSCNHRSIEELLRSIRYYSDIHVGHDSIAASARLRNPGISRRASNSSRRTQWRQQGRLGVANATPILGVCPILPKVSMKKVKTIFC